MPAMPYARCHEQSKHSPLISPGYEILLAAKSSCSRQRRPTTVANSQGESFPARMQPHAPLELHTAGKRRPACASPAVCTAWRSPDATRQAARLRPRTCGEHHSLPICVPCLWSSSFMAREDVYSLTRQWGTWTRSAWIISLQSTAEANGPWSRGGQGPSQIGQTYFEQSPCDRCRAEIAQHQA